MGKLTAKQVENAKPKDKTYRLFDGHGMYLEVPPKGRASFNRNAPKPS